MQQFQVEVDSPYRKAVAFTPDGRTLAVGAKAFTLIDTVNETLRTLPEVGRAYWGATLVSGGAALAYLPIGDGIKVLDLATGRTYGEKGFAYALAADPHADRCYVAIHNYLGKSELRALAVADLSLRAKFAEIDDQIERLRISADGRWLAGYSRNTLRAWHVGGPKLPARAALSKFVLGVGDFALSADGSRLVAGDSHVLYGWDAASGTEVFRSGKHRRGVTAVACSPTRPLVVSGDNAGKVFLWDHAGRVLTRFDWGLGRVSGLAFAADGLRCAAVGGTGKVVVWDVDA